MHFDPLAIVLEGHRPSDNPQEAHLAVEKHTSALERKQGSDVMALGGDRVLRFHDLCGVTLGNTDRRIASSIFES